MGVMDKRNFSLLQEDEGINRGGPTYPNHCIVITSTSIRY